MLIVETWRPLVQWSPKDDAHTWLRSDDRRAMRPTGRVKYSYNGVQEIVGGTLQCCGREHRSGCLPKMHPVSEGEILRGG
ncbi:MAG: hypothetical protein Nkreftii_000387 [Candidatus Nitrospira kreftii]|uniref:Uncharacterized protein n=1 Tax=Candidatus Nitrospira kreftii TaxID=2652173 RepID=A0A7S8IXV9_9BACT|nr:MAG: hypothetical protein Nkreftii_000387 [Candidatus Nitrospira kreftii]